MEVLIFLFFQIMKREKLHFSLFSNEKSETVYEFFNLFVLERVYKKNTPEGIH